LRLGASARLEGSIEAGSNLCNRNQREKLGRRTAVGNQRLTRFTYRCLRQKQRHREKVNSKATTVELMSSDTAFAKEVRTLSYTKNGDRVRQNNTRLTG
jgi:hypothetical protein